jgi:hypothetical protein
VPSGSLRSILCSRYYAIQCFQFLPFLLLLTEAGEDDGGSPGAEKFTVSGCLKTFRYKAPEVSRSEAYM